MKIESIIKRPGGTSVTLGGVVYHFAPDAEGRHVADVDNPEHVGVLLGIKEGYRYLAESQPLAAAAGGEKAVESVAEGAAEGEANTLQPADEAQAPRDEQEVEAEQPKLSEADQREQAAQKYQEVFGSRPHGKWTTERILAELAEAEQGE